MSRDLFDEHLDAAMRHVEAAKAAEDPNTAVGLIHRAMTRLRNAQVMAVIEADDQGHAEAVVELKAGEATKRD